jgi:alpha-glucosidase (family GH31 glycosyl hydrolase)
MSLLIYNSRPYVVFDPSNKKHRKWFAEFQKYRTWGKCPVRFIVTDDGGDLVTLCQKKLVAYYTTKEFE